MRTSNQNSLPVSITLGILLLLWLVTTLLTGAHKPRRIALAPRLNASSTQQLLKS